jgi:hypothetical protein
MLAEKGKWWETEKKKKQHRKGQGNCLFCISVFCTQTCPTEDDERKKKKYIKDKKKKASKDLVYSRGKVGRDSLSRVGFDFPTI